MLWIFHVKQHLTVLLTFLLLCLRSVRTQSIVTKDAVLFFLLIPLSDRNLHRLLLCGNNYERSTWYFDTTHRMVPVIAVWHFLEICRAQKLEPFIINFTRHRCLCQTWFRLAANAVTPSPLYTGHTNSVRGVRISDFRSVDRSAAWPPASMQWMDKYTTQTCGFFA